MKIIYLFLLITSILNAKIYYSKVEPYELRNISSNVSGLVLFIDENMIGKTLSSSPYIKIDAELDQVELQHSKDKLLNLNNILSANQKKLDNLVRLIHRKRINYKKVKVLKIKSTLEKDKEFYDLMANENQLLNTKNEINDLEFRISDLKSRKSTLMRSIKDKNLQAKGFVLYSLLVRAGQVVGMATPLAQIADISKAKLTIYLDYSDLQDIKKKTIYIDGKVTDYKLTRLLHISDSKNISKYKAQIIIKAPENFSRLAKIELK